MGQKIIVNEFKSSELSPEFNKVISITIEDKHFAQGGFGKIFHCLAINERPLKKPQAIKIFEDNGAGSVDRGYHTLQRLQDEVIRHNNELKKAGEKTLDLVNALKALPQFSFQGRIGQKKFLGYSADLLDAKSWCQFDAIFNHDDISERKMLRTKFYNIPVDNRLMIAHDLAEGFSHLGRMNFIYADLNPQNFFVNMTNFQLCLIDYEGGAVNDDPETFGKPGEWLAPEIQEQLRIGQSRITVDMHTDTWAVAIAVHFILFPFHPLFFLKVRGKNEMRDYLSKYQYPNIDLKDKNFREPKYYEWYLKQLKNIPPGVIKAFADTINHGHDNRNKRLTYKQWTRAIENLMHPPEILHFNVSPHKVISGQQSELSWQLRGSPEKIIIQPGIGDVTGKSKIQISPGKSIMYEILAKNAFGNSRLTASVEVLPAPEIRVFSVRHQKLKIGQATELFWEINNAKEVGIMINGKFLQSSFKGQMVIQPQEDSIYEIVITALDAQTIIKKSLKVFVYQEVKIKDFKADQYFIMQSMQIILSWSVQNANEIKISTNLEPEKNVTSKKSLTVSPGKSTTYIITAKNEMFSATESLCVDVQPLPILPRLDSLIPTVNILPKLTIDFNHHVKSVTDNVEMRFETWFKPNRRWSLKDVLFKLLKK